MQTQASARIDTSSRAWRVREIIRALFTRRTENGTGIWRGILDVTLTLLFGHFVCALMAPGFVVLLSFAKEDFPALGSRISEDPEILLGGWAKVAALEQPGIENVSAIVFTFALLVFVLFAYYVVIEEGYHSSLNALGMPKGIRHGEYGDGGVEDNQIVLAQIHRTIDPRRKFDHAGLPVGYSALLHCYFMSGLSNHTATIASPGVGKTTRYLIQMVYLLILAQKDSVVIFDPKGEAYGCTGSFARDSGSNVIVWDFDQWKRSMLYNCISEVYTVFIENWKNYNELVRQAANALLAKNNSLAHYLSKQAEMLRIEAFTTADAMAGSLAYALIPETRKTDEYWTPSARNFFHALVGAVATYTQDQWVGEGAAPYEPLPQQRTLKTIAYLIDQTTKWNREEGKLELTNFFDGLGTENPFSKKYSQVRNAEGANLSSLISSLNKYLGETSSPANDIIGYGMPEGYENLEAIGEKKTIVYIIVSTESANKKVMLPIITKQIYDALIRCSKKHGGKLPYMTHFLMEELGSMSLIGDLEEFLRTGRGYGIRIHTVLQSENQWRSMYGADHERTLKNSINCTNYVSVDDAEIAEALSKEIGDTTIRAKSESVRGGILSIGDVSYTQRHEKIRAVPASKIQEFNPEWGNFVRIDKLYEDKLLNKLLFHRKTSRIAIFPTVKARYMPGSCEMGIETEEKAQAAIELANEEDRSALLQEIPPWNPFNKSEKDHREVISVLADRGAVGLSTKKDVLKAVKNGAVTSLSSTILNWAFAGGVTDAGAILEEFGSIHTEEEVMRAYKRADKRRQNSISKANRMVAHMIDAFPEKIAPQSEVDTEAFLARRSTAQAAWRAGVFDTLNSAAGIRKDKRHAKEKEKPAKRGD